MQRKHVVKLFAVLLVLAMIVTACGSPATTTVPAPAPTKAPDSGQQAGKPADQATAAPAAATGQKKLVIAGVVFQSDTFMQTVQAGMKAAADKAGAEMIMGNTDNKLDKEASMIDDYITRKVDAIVITPISADGSPAALKKAKAAGITIICFNTCVKEAGIASAFLVTKNEDLGMKTGEAAVKFIHDKLGGKAKIGTLNCDQFEGCPPRKAGFMDAVKKLCPASRSSRTRRAGWRTRASRWPRPCCRRIPTSTCSGRPTRVARWPRPTPSRPWV